MDFENMSAKEILQNWHKLHYLLDTYEVKMKYGENKAEFAEKYKKLNLMLRKVNNALDTLDDKYLLIVNEIYFNHKKWEQVMVEQKMAVKTVALGLQKAYKAIDDLAILKE